MAHPAHAFPRELERRGGADGTESIVQPLIEPLYATVSRHEFFAALLGDAPVRNAYEIVRDGGRGAPREAEL